MGTGSEALWLLFAPDSPAGGRVAARWLADRVDDLRELDRTRRVVVSIPSWQQDDAVLGLLEHASALVHHQYVRNEATAEAFAAWVRSIGLSRGGPQLRTLLVEEASPPLDGALQTITGLPVIGRLPFVSDEKLLRLRFRDRGSAFGKSLSGVAEALAGIIEATGDPSTLVTSLPHDRLTASMAEVAPEEDRRPRPARLHGGRDVSA